MGRLRVKLLLIGSGTVFSVGAGVNWGPGWALLAAGVLGAVYGVFVADADSDKGEEAPRR